MTQCAQPIPTVVNSPRSCAVSLECFVWPNNFAREFENNRDFLNPVEKLEFPLRRLEITGHPPSVVVAAGPVKGGARIGQIIFRAHALNGLVAGLDGPVKMLSVFRMPRCSRTRPVRPEVRFSSGRLACSGIASPC